MITLYSGTCGSGKSYHAVNELYLWLVKKKRMVITNIPIDLELLKKMGHIDDDYIKNHYFYVDNNDLTVEFLYRFSSLRCRRGKENECLIIIDEAGDIFNPREFDRSDRLDWLKFFRIHRHYGYQVLLISQNDRYIDRQIRGVIEIEVKHRNFKYYKFIGLLLSTIFRGLFMTVEYYYPIKARNSSSILRLHRKRANLYDTLSNYIEFDDNAVQVGIRQFSAAGVPLE